MDAIVIAGLSFADWVKDESVVTAVIQQLVSLCILSKTLR